MKNKKTQFIPPIPGAIPSPPDTRDVPLSAVQATIELRNLPETYIIPYKLRISNQNGFPRCVAYSAATLKEEKERREQMAIDFDGDWIYQECKKIDNYSGPGTYLRVALKVLNTKGAKPLDQSETEAERYKIGAYASVDNLSIQGLKSAIYQNGAIMAGFIGSSAGWQTAYVRPPQPGEATWGHAVCVHPETKILTFKGCKPIKEIKVGEYVLSHLGRWQRVNRVSKRPFQGLLNLIRTHNQINPLFITDEHPIYVNKATKWIKYRQKGKERKFNFEWIDASEVKKYDFILSPIPQYYPIPLSENLAYLLGLYIADGNLKRGTLNPLAFKALRFSLNKEVDDIVQKKLINIFRKEFNLLPHFYYSKQGKDVQIIFYDAKLARYFSKLGGQPNQKKLDFDLLLGLSPNILEQILEGWIDGDGYRFENKRKIFTSSEILAYQLQIILQRCNYSYGIQKVQRNSGFENSQRGWSIEFQKIKKHSKTHYLGNNEIKKIENVKKVFYEGEVWNLEVNDDNSYIAEGIAVHNCLIGWNKDYIIGQNSWGDLWGDKGLFYIPPTYLPFEAWAILVDLPNDWKAITSMLLLKKQVNRPEVFAMIANKPFWISSPEMLELGHQAKLWDKNKIVEQREPIFLEYVIK